MQLLAPIAVACIVAFIPVRYDACKNTCLRTCIDLYALQHMFVYATMRTITDTACLLEQKRQKMHVVVCLCTKTCTHEKKLLPVRIQFYLHNSNTDSMKSSSKHNFIFVTFYLYNWIFSNKFVFICTVINLCSSVSFRLGREGEI